MSAYEREQPDNTAVERGVARQSLFRILTATLILAAVMVIVYFAFSAEQRRAQYHAYTQQLYHSALLYQATHATAMEYDSIGAEYDYIRDAGKFDSFTYGGEIEVAFLKDGELHYARWTRGDNNDLIDNLVPKDYYYPSEYAD